ncbi:MAG: nitroreductase/quinone reductase family protein [Catenulispora sp.]
MHTQEERRAVNQEIVEEFRANAGTVKRFPDTTIVLLHHVGAKTGAAYISPLAVLPQPDGTWVIQGANGGRDTHPAWYHNLQANPRTVIELPGDGGVRTVQVIARITHGAERDRLADAVAAVSPLFRQFRDATSRQIPVVVLEPVEASQPA